MTYFFIWLLFVGVGIFWKPQQFGELIAEVRCGYERRIAALRQRR